jgi:uncharacterized membrane protein YkvA (DUF1232 family)
MNPQNQSRLIARWKRRAASLQVETYALWLAYKDPRTPWYAKAASLIVAGYAFSPLDLIPDFIPILGYLDDLILIPLGLLLAIKLIPGDVMAECRSRARERTGPGRPRSWSAAIVVVAIWLAILAVSALILFERF